MKTTPLISSLLIMGAPSLSAASKPSDPAHRFVSSITALEDSPRKQSVIPGRLSGTLTTSGSNTILKKMPNAMRQPGSVSAPLKRLAANDPKGDTSTDISLPPLIRHPVLKMLAKSSTYPLSSAIKASAARGLQRPTWRLGHTGGILPKTAIAGLDNFLYEQVDKLLDRLLVTFFKNQGLKIDPLKHAGVQLFKEAMTCLVVISAMNALENAHQRAPLHQGVLPELGITLAHLLITKHVNQLTNHRLTQLMAKMAIPLLMSAQDGAILARRISADSKSPADITAYASMSAAAKTLQILTYELLKWAIPPNATPSSIPSSTKTA